MCVYVSITHDNDVEIYVDEAIRYKFVSDHTGVDGHQIWIRGFGYEKVADKETVTCEIKYQL